jgi:hypothetical protein
MKLSIICLIGALVPLVESNAQNCYIGSYKTPNGPWNDCAGYTTCETGSYCLKGAKLPCPPGTYGGDAGLASAQCSGPCPPGFYCPLGAKAPIPCGNTSLYCPAESASPKPIPVGYYGAGSTDFKLFESIVKCPKGSYCFEGHRYACLAGHWGDSEGLSTEVCSGECPVGYFCPTGTAVAKSHPCLSSSSTYCPVGSARPVAVDEGYYATDSHVSEGAGFGLEAICPAGSFCLQGVRRPCPSGRFGATQQMMNASCTGVCRAGWYCPAGSTSTTQTPCGDSDVYCPEGSPQPLSVAVGHYTVGEEEEAGEPEDDNFHQLNKLAMMKCTPGYYCAADGVRRLCPPGTYGADDGLHSQACSGPCEAGHYCPPASTHPRQLECGHPGVFCPAASGEPLPARDGHYTVGTGLGTMHAERECLPGSYCKDGVKRLCDFGHWGNKYGMNVSTCIGLCAAGHYCPEGSISPTEVQCGDANKYCPGEGTYKPTLVDKGHYSIGGNQSTRDAQTIAPVGSFAQNGILYLCPAGRYGASQGMHTSACSGVCSRGYFCPAGSLSPFMRACGGDDLICPPASIAPIAVASGYYTTDFWSEGCKPGTWRNWTGLSKDATRKFPFPIPTKNLVPDCELCPDGTYKAHLGDSVDLCLPCPLDDSWSSDDRLTCTCYRQQGGWPVDPDTEVLYFNLTSGICHAAQPRLVMKTPALPSDLNTSITRYQEFPCRPGSYCAGGVMRDCGAGRYGPLTREVRPMCEATCPDGYYCPAGTAGRFSNPCGRCVS